MPMSRSEPYPPPRFTIRELIEGRRARADSGGIPPKGYQGEAAQVGLPDGASSAGGEMREGVPDTAVARRVAARHTRGRRGSARATGERRAMGGGAGRGAEGGWRMGGAPTWLGRGQPRPKPHGGKRTTDETREEQQQLTTSAAVSCEHAGRRVQKR